MIVTPNSYYPRAKPSDRQIAAFTKAMLDLQTKFLQGRMPVEETLNSIKEVADGSLILQNLLYDILELEEAGGVGVWGKIRAIEELGWVKLLADVKFQLTPVILHKIFNDEDRWGVRRKDMSFEIGRPGGANPNIILNYLMGRDPSGQNESAAPVKWSDFGKFARNQGIVFGPYNLISALERGNADPQDGHALWSYNRSNYILCAVNEDVFVAEMIWHKKAGGPTLILHPELPFMEKGSRIITKKPCP